MVKKVPLVPATALKLLTTLTSRPTLFAHRVAGVPGCRLLSANAPSLESLPPGASTMCAFQLSIRLLASGSTMSNVYSFEMSDQAQIDDLI